jgi:hypothetical protein
VLGDCTVTCCGEQVSATCRGQLLAKQLTVVTEACPAMLQVIPPGEVGTCFDDIGALDNVKSSLREVQT